ncbi:uncharacterized protein LOC6572578 [Drosophila mojavensis]|uniref:Chitin-binding type-2 domain-containing protein n=1 Tax=Drosophila mojavensis TaxID=7230 RepID=B4K696_DROMO|nr:uncharacterized protein LOC6572578 [Drosophila mojavensis]EDW14146.1 uncharacterized protein Dmoj_GI24105 [Drosophila mojavensis]
MLVERYAAVLAVFLLLWSGSGAQLQVQAQSGYNYVRPELATTAGGGSVAARLQPGAYPTGTAVPLTPAPATAYGAGLFPSPAVGYTPSGQATTAFGAPAAAVGSTVNLPRRPTGSGLQSVSTTARGGPYGPQTQYSNTAVGSSGQRASAGDDYSDGADGDYSAIPGVAGVDYPVYAQVPRTNFDCAQQPLPGYYADIEAQCQVFHICALNRTFSFLCPNGTVFSQETLVCVWWNQYDCVSAPSLYANNAYIYDYSGASSSSSNVNLNANVYRSGSQPVNTAYGGVAPSSAPGGGLRTTSASQVPGYNAQRGAYATPSPTPAQSQSQSLYGAGAIIRPASVSGTTAATGANRLAPATAAAGLAATAAGLLPDNAVGSFAQPVVAVGNREYLPPAGAGQRQQRNQV